MTTEKVGAEEESPHCFGFHYPDSHTPGMQEDAVRANWTWTGAKRSGDGFGSDPSPDLFFIEVRASRGGVAWPERPSAGSGGVP
ncbi:MAG: hypothetical protein MN733_36685, partial [Nitrososphaera sp.]|nr:hypothetical protein [Nitrososphaera sp.]